MEKLEKLSRDYIYRFLEEHNMAVLSTINREKLPEASPIYFVINENFEIFFITSNKTQKYINLIKQDHVFLTVVDEETKETAEIKGEVKEEKELLNEIFGALQKNLLKKDPNPVIPLMENNGQKTVFKVVASEIYMKRYSKNGLEEERINLNQNTPNS